MHYEKQPKRDYIGRRPDFFAVVLKVLSGQIGSTWEWYHWIGLEKDINRRRFYIFFISLLNIWKDFKSLSRFMKKRIQPPTCLDHSLHVIKPRYFPPNRAPKMRERHQLFFGLRLVSKEFQHPAIQTKIAFWRIFSTNKSVPANRKKGFYANRDPNKQEVGFIFAWSRSEVFSNIQEWN